MAKYSLEIKSSARKELERLDDEFIARIVATIDKLASDPRPRGCKKLRGYPDLWRVRSGVYRVVYIIDDPGMLVSITRIAHRREVYE